VGEVQYRTLEPRAERRGLRHTLRDSQRSERDSKRINRHSLDGWVGDLVTVVEGIDFADVAARLARLAMGIFGVSFTRFSDQNGRPRLRDRLAVRSETRVSNGRKNFKCGSNFLYPAVLLRTSKEVSPRAVAPFVRTFVEPRVRRTRLQGGSEEDQCQRL
jgi:hypothetical protein